MSLGFNKFCVYVGREQKKIKEGFAKIIDESCFFQSHKHLWKANLIDSEPVKRTVIRKPVPIKVSQR